MGGQVGASGHFRPGSLPCGADRLFWPPHFAAEVRRAQRQPEETHPHVIKVQVRSNESLEAALRRFKRQCNFSGIFRLAKANTWHEKRSDERRRTRRERLRTIQRATRKNDPNRAAMAGRGRRRRR